MGAAPYTVAKSLRNTRGRHNIEIDTNILEKISLQAE